MTKIKKFIYLFVRSNTIKVPSGYLDFSSLALNGGIDWEELESNQLTRKDIQLNTSIVLESLPSNISITSLDYYGAIKVRTIKFKQKEFPVSFYKNQKLYLSSEIPGEESPLVLAKDLKVGDKVSLLNHENLEIESIEESSDHLYGISSAEENLTFCIQYDILVN